MPATPISKVPGYENGINYKDLSSAMPYMYSDKPERIDFVADIGIVDQIIDWFGNEVKITGDEDEKKVKVSIKASPNAMEHWAMQYIRHVEIISPESLRIRIKQCLTEAIKKY